MAYSFLFYFTIKNGQLCKLSYITVNEEELQILGSITQQIYQDNILRPFITKTALYINFRGNQYGSETLTKDMLISQLKYCCAPGPNNRIHSIMHAVEFN